MTYNKTTPSLIACLCTLGLLATSITGCSDTTAPEKTSAPTENSAVKTVEPLQSLSTITVPELPAISKETLAEYIGTLSSDDFMGRAPTTEGGLKTRAYLVDEMQKIGLKPANGDSFEQTVPLVETTADPAQSFFKIDTGNGNEITPVYVPDTVYWTKRVAEQISFDASEMVFVGYGIVAPEYDWNDYAGLDVTGKTVVMLVNDPGYKTGNDALFNGNAMTYYGRWTYKYEEAARQGAAAALVIHQEKPAAYGWGVVEGSWTGPQLDLERPEGADQRVALEGWITEETASALFNAAGLDFAAQQQAALSSDFQATLMGELKASGQITNTIRRSHSANVAGILEGTTHPEEVILYMAHWDHLGVDANAPEGTDAIYNGAVDNATGTGAILAIAKSFAQADIQPERSIMFLAVTAEESGLLGSAYFSEDPLVPFKNIIGGINIDAMLPTPPTKDIIVVGYGASELENILENESQKRGQYLRPDSEPEKGYFYRSDHISLSKKGVPMLYADSGIDFIDGGEELGRAFGAEYITNRYHKPADNYDSDWDFRGMKDTSELFRDVGAVMAYSNIRPNWFDGNEFRAIRDAQLAE